MKLTLKFLENNKACGGGVDWFKNQSETDLRKICLELMEQHKSSWANWVLVRKMNRKQKIQYAIYTAEQVIDIYEKKYRDDKRPREAINAAKKVLKSDTKKNRANAAAAYAAAYAAAAVAYADAAAYAAAYAAAAAAYAAYADAAVDAAYAAVDAAYAAADADDADDARKEMQIKIVKYGLRLIKA